MLEGVDVLDLSVTTAYDCLRYPIHCHPFCRTVSPAAVSISKDMKKRGFNFVGPTIVQSFLQATGLYHCHDEGCFRTHVKKVK